MEKSKQHIISLFQCSIYTLLLILVSVDLLVAQQPINEALFRNTRWQFCYSSHEASNDVMFRAEEGYVHYVWFKYDGTSITFMNGDLKEESWSVNNEQLDYSFAGVKTWKIAKFNKHVLELAFYVGDSSTYRYHFVRATEESTPFFKYDAGEMGELMVQSTIKGVDPHPYRYLKDEPGKRFRQPSKKNQESPDIEPEQEYLQVEMGGGGFHGKPDYVTRNMVVIKSDGRVIRELKNETHGMRVWKTNISRKHVEDLVAFIDKQGFFEMEQIYGCTTNDCMNRMRERPRPIPLRIAVTKGGRRKVLTIVIFEGVGFARHLVDYPEALDEIYKLIDDISMIAVSQ